MKPTERQDDDQENDTSFFIISGVVTLIIVGLWLLTYYLLRDLKETDRGTFGDMFGSINSLFSGLALSGIVLTILLQRKELKLQREELRDTRREFQTQNETLKRQTEILLSQNLKSHIDRDFDRVKASLARPISRIQSSEEVNLLNITGYLLELYTDIHTPSFNSDVDDYKNGIRQTRSYFTKRDYYKTLTALYDLNWHFAYFNTLINFMKVINSVGLHETDIVLYKRRIQTELIGVLILTAGDIFSEDKGFIIPRVDRTWVDSTEIQFDNFKNTVLRNMISELQDLVK